MTKKTKNLISSEVKTPRCIGGSEFVELIRKNESDIKRQLRKMPALANLGSKLRENDLYSVTFKKEVSRALRKKTAERVLDKKTKKWIGSIRNIKSKKIIGNVRLDKAGDIDSKILNSLDSLALQQSIAEILKRLEAIEDKLNIVLRGQQADRTGQILSGIEMYKQALESKDGENRLKMLHSSLQSLNEGRAKLIEVVRREMETLPEPKKGMGKFIFGEGSLPSKLQVKFDLVHDSISHILIASQALLLIYSELGEPDSANTSIQPIYESLLPITQKGFKMSRYLPYEKGRYEPEKFWNELESSLNKKRILAKAEEVKLTINGGELNAKLKVF